MSQRPDLASVIEQHTQSTTSDYAQIIHREIVVNLLSTKYVILSQIYPNILILIQRQKQIMIMKKTSTITY